MAFPQLQMKVCGHPMLVITKQGCRSGCKQVRKAEAGATRLRWDRSKPTAVQCRACGFRHTLHLTRGLNLSSCQGTSFVNRKMSPGGACPSWLQVHCVTATSARGRTALLLLWLLPARCTAPGLCQHPTQLYGCCCAAFPAQLPHSVPARVQAPVACSEMSVFA